MVSTRPALSRDRVLRAAMDLVDASGIESLTMRRLAHELGVEAMSLYHHVANKDEIVDGMVEMVVDEFEIPSTRTDWKAAIRTMAMSAYDVLVRHPWAANLVLSGAGVGTARLRYMEGILGSLRRAGFSPEMTDHAYHALDSHIMGFTLWEVGMNIGTADELRSLATAFLERLDPAEYPYVTEHVHQHLKPRDAGEVGEFEFGLRLILDGLERTLPT